MKNEAWKNSSEFCSNSKHEKAIQSKSEEMHRKKEIIMRGNGSVNIEPTHGKAVIDKARRFKQKKSAIWQPKKEKNKSGEYDEPLFNENNVQWKAGSMAARPLSG